VKIEKSAAAAKAAPAAIKAQAQTTASKPAEGATARPAAAAKAKAKPSASTRFDPERRRELIAAAARRRKPSSGAGAAPRPLIIMATRDPMPEEKHRFNVGDNVRVISTAGMWFKNGIDFKVTAALPPVQGKLQYRIKNDREAFERVVSESQLTTL
jgi:hypothetical protein